MEGPKSTQVLAASIELERLTPCTEVTAPRPKYDLQELRDQSPEARSRRAKSDYAMQNAGLLETLKERWTKLLEPKEDDVIYDCSPGQVLKWCDSGNGLLAAIEKAYSRHLHLHLRPDDVWLTICQGVSRHLQHGENAEKYRSVFVDHEGQEEITVFVDQFLIPGDSRLLEWPKCVALIAKQLEKRVKGGASQLLTNDFSTTDVLSKTASQIVLMDTMKQYFRYRMMLCCGIPQVTLHGTLADWRRLLEKTRVLRQMEIGLDWWLDHLELVLQQLANTYEGQVDSVWWSQVLTERSYGSGGQSSVGGWVRFFFPYTEGLQKVNFGRSTIDAEDVPKGYVKCPFKLDDHGAVQECRLVAGLPGVKITEDGGVAPCMGWLVQKVTGENETSRVVARRMLQT